MTSVGDALRLSLSGAPTLPLANGGFLRGAHHPHCPRHAGHLLWVFGRPLCLGCTCLGAGLALGVPFGLALGALHLPWIAWLAVIALLVAPTAAQPWVQRKPFKIASRTALGVASVAFWIGLLWLTDFPGPRLGWWAALGGAFFVALRVLLWLRRRRPDDPCAECPLGTFPTCEWNLPRLLGDVEATGDPTLQAAYASALLPRAPILRKILP